VDTGGLGPVRCSRCRGYMNPYVRWRAGGRSFTCNLCGAGNDCPEAYFGQIGPDGLRHDAYDRPELCRGSVDYVATQARARV